MPTLPASALRELRGRAHHLHPVVAIGQHGLTPAVLHEIDLALLAHELIKVRVFNDDRAERDAVLAQICAALDCAPVQHLGKLLVLWRSNPDQQPAKPAPRKTAVTGTDRRAPRKKKTGPRGPVDPVRERRRAGASSTTQGGIVRRGAGRGKPREELAAPKPRGLRDEPGIPKANPQSARRRLTSYDTDSAPPRARASGKSPPKFARKRTGDDFGSSSAPRNKSGYAPKAAFGAAAKPRGKTAAATPKPRTKSTTVMSRARAKTGATSAPRGPGAKPASGATRRRKTSG